MCSTFDADVIVPGHGPDRHPEGAAAACATIWCWCGRRPKRGSTPGCRPRTPRATSSSACTPSWSDAERILPNVMRCYQEFRNETDQDLDVKAMIEGMERLRGSSTGHACL